MDQTPAVEPAAQAPETAPVEAPAPAEAPPAEAGPQTPAEAQAPEAPAAAEQVVEAPVEESAFDPGMSAFAVSVILVLGFVLKFFMGRKKVEA